MKTVRNTCLFLTSLLAVFIAGGKALAASGGAAPIVIVADTRHLEGVMHWWGSLYNESHLQFALLTIVLIPLIGLIFGLLADVFMGWIGIDLRKRQVSEH